MQDTIRSCRTAHCLTSEKFLKQLKTLYSLEFNITKNLKYEKDSIYLYFRPNNQIISIALIAVSSAPWQI